MIVFGVQLIDVFHHLINNSKLVYQMYGKQNPMTDELAIFAFSALTGPNNAHLVPAANTYVQVQVLFKSFMCSINKIRIFNYSFCADFLTLLSLNHKTKL